VERQFLRRGWGEFRSFLDPAGCARWASNFPHAIAFVRGSLIQGAEAPELFQALVGHCGVNPFLYATDDKAVFFGCLSRRVGVLGETPEIGRISLLPTIQRFLRRIVVIREPLDNLVPVVDHQYDLLRHEL